MPSVIETELVEASGFEATKNYERQDYLAALARSVNEVEEATFDQLSVEAQDWFNEAVKSLNKKKELPEFPDAEETEGDEVEAAGEDEAEDEAEEEAPPPKKAKANGKVKAAVEEEVTGDEVSDIEVETETLRQKKKKKEAAISVPPRKMPHPPVGEADRYGVNLNSKGHAALAMLEKGCRMFDVTESIGGTYYNLLKSITKAGHKLEKSANGGIKLIHKDDIKKGKVKK